MRPRILILLLCLPFSACLDFETLKLLITLDDTRFPDGVATMVVTGIHSNEGDVTKRQKEISEFCSAGFKEDGDDLARKMVLHDHKTTVDKVTATGCEATLTGKFENFLNVFAWMFEDGDFSVVRKGSNLQFFYRKYKEDNDDAKAFIGIHKSPRLSGVNTTLQGDYYIWSFREVVRKGMRFQYSIPVKN